MRFWCHNKSCADDRLIKFLNDYDDSSMFPEEVYQKVFANPEKSEAPISEVETDVKKVSEQEKKQIGKILYSIDKNKKRLTSANRKRALRKEANSIGKATAVP